MANTTNFSVRMDSDIKKQCEALYGELGMNLTTAINVFFAAVASVWRFSVRRDAQYAERRYPRRHAGSGTACQRPQRETLQ
jgi:hypothetical protein